MRQLNRNKVTFFLCRRNTTTKVKTFHEPIQIQANFDIARSQADQVSFGENYMKYAKSNIHREIGNLFSELDRIYFTEPNPFDPLCNDADYEVYGVLPSINDTELIFRRLSGSNAT